MGGGGGGGGRKSSQINKVNKILEESCRSHGFLFVEQARCWRDPNNMTEINKNLYWRDGLHLQKKGCNMLASIYANKICNALKEKIYHHLHQPSKETSTSLMLSSSSSSSCSYIHISPQPTTQQNFALYHCCHNHPKFKCRRLSIQPTWKPAIVVNVM